MKELKTYISEGFFNNVGANNIVNPVIDAIKDASTNDKINSHDKMREFTDLLASTLKDIETDIRKGKFAFEYTTRSKKFGKEEITISLEGPKSDDVKWIYNSSLSASSGKDSYQLALTIAGDLYVETAFPMNEPRFQHSIANTIKVTEFKLS